ncbi:MAG: hypothetical protein ACJA2W_000207 [Planctomycetota bacterium]|jgi:hypothetical protein
MNQSYDKDHASKLVPLLEMIFAEVADRRRAIRTLERELKAEKEAAGSTSPNAAKITAALANHKRELRLASKEFERLGCVVDEHNPNRVIIPGASGALDRGFHWEAGASEIKDNSPLDSTVF